MMRRTVVGESLQTDMMINWKSFCEREKEDQRRIPFEATIWDVPRCLLRDLFLDRYRKVKRT